MQNNQSYDATAVALPLRMSPWTLERLRSSASAHGYDLGTTAELYSSNDWMHDMVWLQAECRAQGLSDAQRDTLVDRLRSRNQDIWSLYSKTDGWSVFQGG